MKKILILRLLRFLKQQAEFKESETYNVPDEEWKCREMVIDRKL